MKTYLNYLKDILYVSKLTGVKQKKRKILLSVFLANSIVILDILIILVFADLLGNQRNENKTITFILDFISSNIYLLPIIVILRFLFIYFERMNIHSLQLKIEEKLRQNLLKDVFDKSNYSISDAFFYVNELSKNVSYFYGSLALTLNFLLQLIIYLSYLIFTDLDVIIYFIFGALILFFPTKYLLIKSRDYVKSAYDYEKTTLNSIQKIIENLYLIKILKTSELEITNFNNIIEKFYKTVLNRFRYGAINNIIPNFLTFFLLSIFIAFFKFAENINLEFIGIVLRLFQSLGNFNSNLNLVVNSHVHIEKLYKLESNKVSNNNNIISFKSEETILKFKNTSFKYFGQKNRIFDGLNLNIPKFKHTIIIGPNGSGKSTLLGLGAGVLKPVDGEVFTSAAKIGFIGPSPLILDGTLKENILYGNKEQIDDSLITNFVKEIDLFNNELFTLDKPISNRNLSSGQMQKIGFLRAFVSDIDLLILDESTANLDNKSKKVVIQMLEKLNISILNSTHEVNLFNYDHIVELNVDKHVTSASFS